MLPLLRDLWQLSAKAALVTLHRTFLELGVILLAYHAILSIAHAAVLLRIVMGMARNTRNLTWESRVASRLAQECTQEPRRFT